MTKSEKLLELEHEYLQMVGELPTYSTLEELEVLVKTTKRIKDMNDRSTFTSKNIDKDDSSLLDNRLVRFWIAAWLAVIIYSVTENTWAAWGTAVLTLIMLNIIRAF